MQADLAAQVEDDEGEKRLWAGRGVGRGPLWVEGGEKRGQVSCILLRCVSCCVACCVAYCVAVWCPLWGKGGEKRR